MIELSEQGSVSGALLRIYGSEFTKETKSGETGLYKWSYIQVH